jgi:transposase InsO family protein
MASSEYKASVTKLNGKNYQTWKFNVKCMLMQGGLWGFVTGSETKPAEVEDIKDEHGVVTNADAKRDYLEKLNKYNLRSDKAYSVIALSVEDDLQIHIHTKSTAKEAWDTLKNHCEFVSVTQMVRLTRRFYAAKMEESTDMLKHITEMTSLAQQLREMDEDISSRKFATVILGSLPSSYDNLVTSMSARDITQLDWESVKGVLIEESMKRKEKEKEKSAEDALITRRNEDAMFTNAPRNDGYQHNNNSNRGRSNTRGNRGGRRGTSRNFNNQHPYNRPPQNSGFRGPCFLCQQMGHVARACPQSATNSQQSRGAEEGNIAQVDEGHQYFHENDFALMVTDVASADSDESNANEVETLVGDKTLAEAEDTDARVEDDSVENSVENETPVTVEEIEENFALMNSDETTETEITVPDDHEWYIDSAATKHMSKTRGVLHNFKKFEEPRPVILGDKSNIFAFGEGQLRLPTASGTFLALKEVLFVPRLSKNLLSVPTIAKSGVKVLFDKDQCHVINKEGRSLTIGHCINEKLYKVTSPSESSFITQSISPSPTVWHERYGHLNKGEITKMLKNNVVEGMRASSEDAEGTEDCDACALGKMHRLPFPKKSPHRASKCLEVVHTDLCGPMHIETQSGSKYMLTFIDDHSRFTVVYFLQRKSEVLSKFQEFINTYEKTTSNKVKELNVLTTVRSDNGGEYTSNEFATYCTGKGISRQFTNPDTPQQNGVSERYNRTIMEGVRSMLYHSKSPLFLWAEAAKTMVYLRNRSPTSALDGKTPYEMWHSEKPDVSNLRVFGCVCYVYMSSKKLEPNSYKAIFVGYPDGTKGYKVYNVETESFARSRNIEFHERKFHDFELPVSYNTFDVLISPFNVDENNKKLVTSSTENKAHRETVAPRDKEGENPQGLPFVNPPVPVPVLPNVEVFPTYEETFMRQVSNLNSVRTRRQRDRLLEEEGRLAESCCLTSLIAGVEEPNSYKEALRSSCAEKWKSAMDDEYNSLQSNGTWRLVPRPTDQNVIGSRWTFKLKLGPDGEVVRHKARLVAQGYSQTQGIDFDEVFSPVAHRTTIRALLSYANSNDLHIHQMDVKTAFLNGLIDCDLYMEQPEGYKDADKPDYVCKLVKGIYGLKQAARCWNSRIDEFFTEAGYVKTSADSCIYLKSVIDNGKFIIIVLYVDDIVPMSNDLVLLKCEKETLSRTFQMTDNGEIGYILGMVIKRDRPNRIMSISQPSYVKATLSKFGMSQCKPVPTPMESGAKFYKTDDNDEECDKQRYQQAIGCLTYLSTSTRPDISTAVNTLSQFMSRPNSMHWTAVKRVFRYLNGTSDFGLRYVGGDLDTLVGFSDADWAGDIVTRRSTSGYVFLYGSSLISWRSCRQATVAKSSTEAEYVALSMATQEAIWLRRLFTDLKVDVTEPTSVTMIFEDNQGAIDLSKNPKHHNRTKHIDVSFHFVRERVASKEVDVQYLATEHNVADVMTKGLPRVSFEKFRAGMGVCYVGSATSS